MIIIRVQDNIKLFIKKCISYNIDLYEIKYEEDYILVTIKESDYERVKKLNYYSKIVKYKTLGKKHFLLLLRHNLYNIILLIFFISLITFYSNIIVSVEIKHENKEMIKKIDTLLGDKKIKRFTLSKNNQELNNISDQILAENRDFLDFISITKTGMKYIVNVEERIIKTEEETKERCHIIAKKAGVITGIEAKKGITIVEKGNLVKPGDILISGEVILNEEVKDNICASGTIWANTWYKVNIKYPKTLIETEFTKREKVNVKVYDRYLKKRLYENYEETIMLKIGNLRLVKQKEFIEKETKLSDDETRKKAIEAAENKILEKIGHNNTIIDKKVLKETINDSTIELELFISVNESIGEMTEYELRQPTIPESSD